MKDPQRVLSQSEVERILQKVLLLCMIDLILSEDLQLLLQKQQPLQEYGFSRPLLKKLIISFLSPWRLACLPLLPACKSYRDLLISQLILSLSYHWTFFKVTFWRVNWALASVL